MSTFNKAIANIIKANQETTGLRVAGPVKNVLNNVVVGGVGALSDVYTAERASNGATEAAPLLSAEFVAFALTQHFQVPDEVVERVRDAVRRFAAAEHVKGQSAAARAGLLLPTARIRTLFKQELPEGVRIAEQALVATASFLEYVTAEVWRIGAAATLAARKKTVTLDLLDAGMRADPDNAVIRILCLFRTPPPLPPDDNNDNGTDSDAGKQLVADSEAAHGVDDTAGDGDALSNASLL